MIVTILAILSGLLTVSCTIPYIIEVVKKTTKPRIVSWIIWTILTSIAAIASFTDRQYFTSLLMLSSALATLSVVILGWNNSDKTLEPLDVFCFLGAVVGIILWQVFNSPAIAVIATISVDFIGGVPTLAHAWKKPKEETWITFFLSMLGAICTILIVSDWRITSIAYPIFLVLINMIFTSVIIFRGRFLQTKNARV